MQIQTTGIAAFCCGTFSNGFLIRQLLCESLGAMKLSADADYSFRVE
jgi:hypothetical protein